MSRTKITVIIFQSLMGSIVRGFYLTSFFISQIFLSSCHEEGEFSKYYSVFIGGNGNEVKAIEMTQDMGFIVSGRYDVYDGTTSEKLWVAKTNATGQTIWSKTYLKGTLQSIQKDMDGGYIAAGYAYGTDIGHGDYDFMILKINSDGDQEWYKTLGSPETEKATSIIQTADGNYVVCGSTEAYNYGRSDCWIVKLNKNGSVIWQQSYGGSDYENANSVQQTSDGGYIIAASSSSDNDGDVSGNYSSSDYWILKLDPLGQLVWQQSYGGFEYDNARKIIETNDGGYLVVGGSSSEDGEIDDFRGINDAWIIKLDIQGNITWRKSVGWNGYDDSEDVIQTSDGGFLIIGSSYQSRDEETDHLGDLDYLVIKIDEDGLLEWTKLLGGSGSDSGISCFELKDGNYMITGQSNSKDGHVTGSPGRSAWLIKIDPSGTLVLK